MASFTTRGRWPLAGLAGLAVLAGAVTPAAAQRMGGGRMMPSSPRPPTTGLSPAMMSRTSPTTGLMPGMMGSGMMNRSSPGSPSGMNSPSGGMSGYGGAGSSYGGGGDGSYGGGDSSGSGPYGGASQGGADARYPYSDPQARGSARREPTAAEVLSGDALNGLLIRLTAGQAFGVEGPPVPLPGEDVLRRVDVVRTYAPAVRLLFRDGGRIAWPDSLRAPSFAAARASLEGSAGDAAVRLASDGSVPADVARGLRAGVRSLDAGWRENTAGLSPVEYVEARRFLDRLDDAVEAVGDLGEPRPLAGGREPAGRTVAGLVARMRAGGLIFAPGSAVDGDAYRALYEALRAADTALSEGRR